VSDDLQLAASLVRDAGLLAASMLRDGLTAQRKTSVSDVVSAADHAAEELVVVRLHTERPDDGVVGEEGTSRPAARTWFVDPVDGTYNFLSGIPVWCAAIALVDRDGSVLGAVYQPSTDELWLGGRDEHTTCNGEPVAVLVDRPLAELSLSTYLHPTTLPDDGAREPLLRVMRECATVRMLGSGSVELASVASGRLGSYVQLDSLDWDWYPGKALVEAAGGECRVVTAHGHRWHIAGNRQAVREIAALVLGESATAGLAARLTALVADASARIGCVPNLTTKGALDALPEPVAAALERVITEALANTVRHAYASTVSVEVTLSRATVELTVRDNGVGPQDEPANGTGLAMMSAAAEALGGTFAIEPDPAMGTLVVWRVPYRRGAPSSSR
jgi:fructose-1,6-bisphosphatase/inositol monophosphatase family enzyme